MMLTEEKEKFLDKVHTEVYNQVDSVLYSASMDQGINNFRSTLALAITAGVKSALRQLIDKTYTTQDFEKDVGLR